MIMERSTTFDNTSLDELPGEPLARLTHSVLGQSDETAAAFEKMRYTMITRNSNSDPRVVAHIPSARNSLIGLARLRQFCGL